MAVVNDKRNVVVVYAQDPASTTGLWRANGFQVEDDATVTVFTEQTDVSLDAVKQKVRQPYTKGTLTPENSALFGTDEIHSEVTIPENQLVA